MHNRRKFLQNSAAMVIGGIAMSQGAGAFAAPGKMPPIGLQLYTFFNVIDTDVEGTLKKIAGIGYKEIESAFSRKRGYYGMDPKAFGALLKDLGMTWKAHHVLGAPFKLPPGAKMPVGADGKPIVIPPMRNLRDDMQQLVDEAAAGGVPFLVCANTPISTLDDVKQSAEVLSKTGEACKKAGVHFAYHNHDAEFHAVEGIVPYEYFLSQTDTDKVKMELDLAWAVKGGKDPIELFNQHPGRFPLWHVKDLDAKHETVLPVGAGTINYKRIFSAAKLAGMQHFFVEHDMPADPFASVTSSFRHITKMLEA